MFDHIGRSLLITNITEVFGNDHPNHSIQKVFINVSCLKLIWHNYASTQSGLIHFVIMIKSHCTHQISCKKIVYFDSHFLSSTYFTEGSRTFAKKQLDRWVQLLLEGCLYQNVLRNPIATCDFAGEPRPSDLSGSAYAHYADQKETIF